MLEIFNVQTAGLDLSSGQWGNTEEGSDMMKKVLGKVSLAAVRGKHVRQDASGGAALQSRTGMMKA
jgi:hypothetical protein